jgi:hydroxymethylbilane synthase
LHDADTARAVTAERLLLAACEGGCSLPLGAYATLRDGGIRLVAALGRPDGSVRRAEVTAAEPAPAAAAAHRILTA